MRKLFPALFLAALQGCSALGGISPGLTSAVQSAAASCIRVESLVMGKAVVVMANDVKGAITNGSVSVNPDTCGMTISNAPISSVVVVPAAATVIKAAQ